MKSKNILLFSLVLIINSVFTNIFAVSDDKQSLEVLTTVRLEQSAQAFDFMVSQSQGNFNGEIKPLTPGSLNPLSGCLGSACGGSVCFGSACGGSICFGSACASSSCFGSGCSGSVCSGSACGSSGCAGSVCIGSVCAGSVCAGSVCAGSACVGSPCGGK